MTGGKTDLTRKRTRQFETLKGRCLIILLVLIIDIEHYIYIYNPFFFNLIHFWEDEEADRSKASPLPSVRSPPSERIAGQGIIMSSFYSTIQLPVD